MKTLIKSLLFLLMFFLIHQNTVRAQNFTRVSVTNIPDFSIASAFIDYDNDGDIDIINVIWNSDTTNSKKIIYRNDGSDVFTRITGQEFVQLNSGSISISAADEDNDGDIDMYITEGNFGFFNTTHNSALWRNDGSGIFNRITTGSLSSLNLIAGNGTSFGDFDNDGDVDLYICINLLNYPPPFDTLASPSRLYINNGDGTYTRDTTSLIAQGPRVYHQAPRWSDYDLDGDLDLSIGNAPLNGNFLPDYFYKNMLMETNSPDFIRDTTSNFAAEPRDGEDIRWIDYDNDRDLDLFVTNAGLNSAAFPPAGLGKENHFYRNEGNGNYEKITTGSIATDVDISVGQTWGDFDNDGDLDLYVSSATSTQNFTGRNRYYRNDGAPDYTFTRINTGDFVSGPRVVQSGAVSGDYDNDGDLDLYVPFLTGTGSAALDALYRNDDVNGNSWINIKCEGIQSNRSAIGVKIFAKANYSGNDYWQMREISSNDGLFGHSDVRVHFGFGDATIIDSLRIEWTSGMTDVYTNVQPNLFYKALEGTKLSNITSIEQVGNEIPSDFTLKQNYPNPFNPTTTIEFSIPKNSNVTLKVFNSLGREVETLINKNLKPGNYAENFNAHELPSGMYFYKLIAGDFSETRKMLLVK